MDTKSVTDKRNLELAILRANALNKRRTRIHTPAADTLNNPQVQTVLLHTERPQAEKGRTSYFRIRSDNFFCRSVCIFQIYAGNTLHFW